MTHDELVSLILGAILDSEDTDLMGTAEAIARIPLIAAAPDLLKAASPMLSKKSRKIVEEFIGTQPNNINLCLALLFLLNNEDKRRAVAARARGR